MYSREDVLRSNKDGRIAVPGVRSHEPGAQQPPVAPAPGALSRRSFMKVSATVAGGLVVSMYWDGDADAQSAPGSFQPNAFIRIDPDDTVTIWSRNPDMGEGVKTALSMIIVEELDADWSRVKIENAPLDRRFGPQGVGGSDAIASGWDDHRRAGATARQMIAAAAAALWNVPLAEITTAAGVARHDASARTARYGELAARAAAMPVPETPSLKDAARYRLIGSRTRGVDNHAIVTGQRLFGLDVKVAGMKYAAVAKAPVFGQRPLKIDSHKALQVPGVRQVIEIHGLENPTQLQPGVAVIADSTWAAFKGRETLVVEWVEGPFASESSATLSLQCHELLAKPAFTLHTSGDVDQALAAATHVVENTCEFAFVSHATLEPHNCTAHFRDGDCFVTGPLQMPASGRAVVAAALGIPPDRVHVAPTRIGGGFGRRLLSDYAAEAAVLSRAVGAPVQVIDDRAGDLQHDYYRPAAVQRIRAGADASGRLVAWDHVLVSVSRNAYRKDPRPPFSTETYGSYIGRATKATDMDPDLVPTRIPHARLRYAAPRTGVPTGAWRAPSHVVNAFAIETTIDELAVRAGRSAVDMRLDLLGETADVPPNLHAETLYDPSRMRRVLLAAAERGGYGGRAPEGRARGLAAHFTFGSYCAQVVELSIDTRKRVVIHAVTAVADVGQPVNLSGLEAQGEGGIIDGLGAAFFGDVPIERGRAMVSNFDRYRMIRQRESPTAIEVTFLPSRTHPSGFGEIAIPPIAPAVANAIAALTGERLRRMPFSKVGYDLGPPRGNEV
jgi:isoquinoline 1-oxidoreductase beta subunit